MKNAVDQLYALLTLNLDEPVAYEREIRYGERYTAKRDDPKDPPSG